MGVEGQNSCLDPQVVGAADSTTPAPGCGFTDHDRQRLTAFVTNTTRGNCPTWNYVTAAAPAARTASETRKTLGWPSSIEC